MNNYKNAFDSQGLMPRLLKRTGSMFISWIVLLAQLPFFLGALVGGAIIQTNAALATDQFLKSAAATLVVIIIGFLVVLILVYLITRIASKRLGIWAHTGVVSQGDEEELTAWKQITSLPWRYSLISFTVVLIELSAVAAYDFFILKFTNDQIVYSFLGGLVPGIGVVVLAILLIERMLGPARETLLPVKFERQLVPGSNFSYIFSKFLVSGMAFIIITALLIAPIGYHQTYQAIYEEIGSQQLFNELRTELIVATVFAGLVGLVITLLLTRSMTTPLNSLIQTFNKVEQGNLSERARVLTTDEIGEVTIYFNRMISRLDELQQTLEKRVAERTDQLRASNEVGRIASTILDPDTLINRVVELITESFDYYYAAIFLIDENEHWAELKAATGSAGKILLERHHRLQITRTSMVGTAVSMREPQVALDVGVAAVRFNNPLLPNTRSEIALPLVVAGRVIGALDVQSIRGADFNPDIISTLQSMANQVAIAIENARLFKEMDQALDELRQSNRQYVLSAWSDKLKSTALEYTTGSVLNQSNSSSRELEVNLNLRDESIGVIRLEKESEWSKEDKEWVEALATQVAVSLENARLVEESQQTAFREKLSASIIQKLWSANSVEGILQTAIHELGRAFEVSEATILLNQED